MELYIRIAFIVMASVNIIFAMLFERYFKIIIKEIQYMTEHLHDIAVYCDIFEESLDEITKESRKEPDE